ncbi:unnamed protein product [Rotaria sp. Silwood1]|nr:unnamed protein product [Rotaria sp. Silwood1]
MLVKTNRVEPTSPNGYADSTSVQERRTHSSLTGSRHSIGETIEKTDSGINLVQADEKKTLKRHLGTGIFISPKGVLRQTQSVGLCLVIWALCGIVSLLSYTENLKSGFHGSTTNNPLGVALAFYSGLWAYQGWSSLNSVTEELKNPKRNLWLAIVVALSSVIIIYLLINISYFTVMSKAELLSSDAVAVTWGVAVLGPAVRVLPFLISLSALGSVNVSTFRSARYAMVGARHGYLPEVFSYIQKQRLTPLPGIILQTILTIIYCIPSDIEDLIDFSSFVVWVFNGLTFVATICCKFTKPNAYRAIKVPIPVIIFNILISIYLVIAPVISRPHIGYLIATIILLLIQATVYPCNKAAPCGCSKNSVSINARIVGGEVAPSHSWGWAVSLQKRPSRHFCGGSILSPKYVLTAAHCVDDIYLSIDQLTVVVGRDNLLDNIGQRIVVSKIYVHPQWIPNTFKNDIAILELSRAISFGDNNIAKLCLPSSYGMEATDFPLMKSKLVGIGWGTTMTNGFISDKLRQVTVEAVGNQESKCSNSITNKTTQFCAAVNGGGKDTCQGDSGGPLMYYSDIYEQWMLAGITSFGKGCGLSIHAGVYTRVNMYIDWIQSIVGNDGIVMAGENTATFSTMPNGLTTSSESTMSSISTMFCITTLVFLLIMRSF